jgi:HD-like signal output (HDOD) protein
MKLNGKPSILFVANESDEVLALQSELSQSCPDWNVEFVSDSRAALARLVAGTYDVIFLDTRLSSGCALALLDTVWQTHPETLRFVCTRSPDQALTLKCVWNSHRLFTDPLTPESIRSATHRALELRGWQSDPAVQARVSRMRVFPAMPSLYFKVAKIIESPEATVEAVAQLIESDLAISTQLIRVVNSAYYGYEGKISRMHEAIQVLGFGAIKSLVLAVQAFAQMDGVKPVYFSIEKVWRHGLAVAKWAREIAEFESNDPLLAEHAYTAGLLHDIGKVVFAANLNADYDAALTFAREKQISCVAAEAEILGATHAQIAAYLTALWGLPRAVVEAIGFHHAPDSSRDEAFSPLTAVYVANLFKNERASDGHSSITSPLALDYLNRVGVADKIELWAAHLGVEPVTPPAPNRNRVAGKPIVAARRSNLTSRMIFKWRNAWPF